MEIENILSYDTIKLVLTKRQIPATDFIAQPVNTLKSIIFTVTMQGYRVWFGISGLLLHRNV